MIESAVSSLLFWDQSTDRRLTMNNTNSRMRRVRALLVFFIFALAMSGITAIPLQWELGILNRLAGPESVVGSWLPRMAEWIGRVNQGVQTEYGQYPFLAYGTDWLAFGHIVIAIAFIGPLRDPAKNLWVFGIIPLWFVRREILAVEKLKG